MRIHFDPIAPVFWLCLMTLVTLVTPPEIIHELTNIPKTIYDSRTCEHKIRWTIEDTLTFTWNSPHINEMSLHHFLYLNNSPSLFPFHSSCLHYPLFKSYSLPPIVLFYPELSITLYCYHLIYFTTNIFFPLKLIKVTTMMKWNGRYCMQMKS